MRLSTAGALVAAVAVLGAGPVLPQPPAAPPTLRSAVDLVSVTAVVKDKHGRFVRDLSADDFLVLDRGEPRAAEELLPLVYDELRRLAAAQLAQEKPGQTLQWQRHLFIM